MAKHLVHHSHKEKQKLCTIQNNTLENPRNTYLCNGYMKKNKQMRATVALVTIVRPTVCTPPKLSIEAHESERGTIMLLFIFWLVCIGTAQVSKPCEPKAEPSDFCERIQLFFTLHDNFETHFWLWAQKPHPSFADPLLLKPLVYGSSQ